MKRFATAHRVELPGDWPVSAGRPFETGRVTTDPSPALRESLEAAAGTAGVSAELISLALFIAFLHRHSQQAEIAVGVVDPAGTLLSGGPGAGARFGTVRIGMDAGDSFARLPAALAEQVRALPANAIPAGDATPPADANVRWTSDAALRPCAGIDLSLSLEIQDGRAMLAADFDRALFRADRIEEWLAQILLLAEQVREDPHRGLLDYSLITARGRDLLPDPSLAMDAADYPPITETILGWCTRTPEQAAVSESGRTWSYRELAEASEGVARHLLARGLASGDTVAVTGPRCFALVASMLGVWRAGGVMFALEPKLPEERRRTMVAEARVRFLIGIDAAADALGDAVEALVRVDPATARPMDPEPNADATELPVIVPAQPAHIFFTSGSTGVPKGVKGRHLGLAHFLHWQRTAFDVQPGDRASQLTALSFEMMLRDMFLILTAGGTLCVPAEGDILDPARILAWLESESVSVLHVVPSLARMWLNYVPEAVRLPSLRLIFFVGEPLMDTLVGKWRGRFPGATEMVNTYGPTETTLSKCFHRLGETLDPGIQPIGRPIPDTQILILNPKRTPCGLTETGEIAIRTPYRTQGYINNAEAQAKAFIPNPFVAEPGEDLIYLSGDSGRYRLDGRIDILGRIDNQVKIRGVRIEPGEIEAVIGRHAGVLETSVVARRDESGEKFLVAYLVPKQAADPEARAALIADVRAYLRERLPDNLVPSAFMALERLPLNPNGKVDKLALPAPDRSAFVGADYSPPEDELQHDLAELWQELLGLERIGIDDNFFDLGGHSLMAVQLVHAIEERLKQPCSLTRLFRAPTIRLLADAITIGDDGPEGAAVLPLQAKGEGPALFCIVGIHLYQALADTLAPEVPVYGIFLPYEEELFARQAAGEADQPLSMQEIAAGYVEAVRSQQPNGPYLLAGLSFGGVLAYEMAQQLTAAGERVAFLGILDSMLPAALKRNWVRWAGGHVGKLLEQGPGYLLDKLKHRLGRSAPSAETEAAEQIDEAERLGRIRGEIYKQAELAYEVKPYAGPAVLVRAEDKSWFGSDISDPTYGWGEKIEHLYLIDAPGGHLGILEEPHVRVLADQLRPHIDAARRASNDAPRR